MVCLMVRSKTLTERCCATLPKLRYVRDKQEVYVHGYQSRSRHESKSQSQRRRS